MEETAKNDAPFGWLKAILIGVATTVLAAAVMAWVGLDGQSTPSSQVIPVPILVPDRPDGMTPSISNQDNFDGWWKVTQVLPAQFAKNTIWRPGQIYEIRRSGGVYAIHNPRNVEVAVFGVNSGPRVHALNLWRGPKRELVYGLYGLTDTSLQISLGSPKERPKHLNGGSGQLVFERLPGKPD